FIFMLLLTWFYIQFGIKSQIFQFIFSGFQAAVIALIFMGTYRIGKHALINVKLFIIGLISAAAHFAGISFFIVLPLAGIAYILLMKKSKTNLTLIILLIIFCCGFLFQQNHSEQTTITAFAKDEITNSSPVTIFFSGLKGGLLTFGGAYTVIPFIQQDAVINNGWMTNEQFLDGIALSGILPAPLIIFTTFVGYFAGSWLGALIMTAAIFLPAFCFTLIGHNYIQKVTENKALHNFLDGVTAGVIGLIAVTAIKLFQAAITDVLAIAIFIVALLALYFIKSKFTIVFVIIGAGAISMLYHILN
ncbi:MAG TPA: chromate efflux transporter, partial [Bacteroidia bacterium]|nr:chromate efflux transporter [Bacteroidia bacterium]